MDAYSLALLESIENRANPNTLFHANLFVHLLFCKYVPGLDVPLTFDFTTGFGALASSLNRRFPEEGAWNATKGGMGYNGTILHLIFSNLFAPHCGFAGNVKAYFGYDLEASHDDIADYCISEEGLRGLLPTVYQLLVIEPESVDAYGNTAIESMVRLARSWCKPPRLRTFMGQVLAIVKGTFVRPIQRAVRKWYQRRRRAADVINRSCFEYVMHPDCPVRRRFLSRTKLLAAQ